jgi:hypothetical protein
MTMAKFDPIGRARQQAELLARVPEPGEDPVFLEAALSAVRNSDLSAATVAAIEKFHEEHFGPR